MRKLVLVSMLFLILYSCSGCGVLLNLHSVENGSTSSTDLPPTSISSEAPQPTATIPVDTQTLPMLTQERMALIEAYWDSYCGGRSADQSFCDPEPGKYGMRYYGSITRENWKGDTIVYDIVYIPFPDIEVSASIDLRGFTFDGHRCAFGLYIFALHTGFDNEIGMRWASFEPLHKMVNADSWSDMDDEILAYAAQLHRQYEGLTHQSNGTWAPPVGEEYEHQRVQAAWLHCFGFQPDFENSQDHQRYYGKFDGYDVFYCYSGGAPGVYTQIVIGNEVFVNGPFTLLVYKYGCIYTLEEAYELGMISAEVLSQIAQIHNQFEEAK